MKKVDYFRLEQTKEGLRFNNAEKEERDKEESEKKHINKLFIQKLSSRRLANPS